MPLFNLRDIRRQAKRKIDRLNELVRSHERVRPSDFEGVPEGQLDLFFDKLRINNNDPNSSIRTALHGTGDTWSPLETSPYQGSPLTTFAPQFGGEWRTPEDLPKCDQHINDDDQDKNYKHTDLDDPLTMQKVREKLDKAKKEMGEQTYIVRIRAKEGQDPEALAQKLFGPKGKSDGGSAYVEVVGLEDALDIQRVLRGSICEPKGKEKQDDH